MEQLIERYVQKLKHVQTSFVRGLMRDVNWDARLIGIKGARGVGKTTLLLQYIKLHIDKPYKKALYVSLDNLWFSEHRLTELVDYFVKRGGMFLFLDEVHKYPDWSVEIKNLYDDYPGLQIVFTGSSLLEILNARADLSRRAVVYTMQGLSFREFLGLNTGVRLEGVTLPDLLSNHQEIAGNVLREIKPFEYFDTYLKQGYYPFFSEQPDLYHSRLEEVVNLILEVELPMLRQVQVGYVPKVKQLLHVIAESVPFVPNISKLSQRIGINRETLLAYLHYLNETHLIFSVYNDVKGISLLQKPDKVFLENTNLMYNLNRDNANLGNLRETFFANQLKAKHLVEIARTTDFVIDGNTFFEIGGKNKGKTQLSKLDNAFIAKDDIEIGHANVIPLWLFGFLY